MNPSTRNAIHTSAVLPRLLPARLRSGAKQARECVQRLPRLLAGLLYVALTCFAQAREVVDVTGRSVFVPDRVARILLGEGRLFYALAMLEGDNALSRVAGWQGDFRTLDTQGYAAFAQVFPSMDRIPVVGGATPDTFSVEQALALAPDVAFLTVSGGHGPMPGSEAVRLLEAAGVPIVFVDFGVQPLRNTVPSIRVMGEVLGRSLQAQDFIDFYQAQMQIVADRLRDAAKQPGFKRPTVFIDMLAGVFDCCNSPGRGNFGDMIELAGGENIGAAHISGPKVWVSCTVRTSVRVPRTPRE